MPPLDAEKVPGGAKLDYFCFSGVPERSLMMTGMTGRFLVTLGRILLMPGRQKNQTLLK
jgi:hypothetical protein